MNTATATPMIMHTATAKQNTPIPMIMSITTPTTISMNMYKIHPYPNKRTIMAKMKNMAATNIHITDTIKNRIRIIATER